MLPWQRTVTNVFATSAPAPQVFVGCSLTRLCLLGFILCYLRAGQCRPPRPVPPEPAQGSPRTSQESIHPLHSSKSSNLSIHPLNPSNLSVHPTYPSILSIHPSHPSILSIHPSHPSILSIHPTKPIHPRRQSLENGHEMGLGEAVWDDF